MDEVIDRLLTGEPVTTDGVLARVEALSVGAPQQGPVPPLAVMTQVHREMLLLVGLRDLGGRANLTNVHRELTALAEGTLRVLVAAALLLLGVLLGGCGSEAEPSGRREPEPAPQQETDETEQTEQTDEVEDPAPDPEAEPLVDDEEEEADPLGTPDFQLREPGLGEGEEVPGPDFQLREPSLGTDLPGTILVPPAGEGGEQEEEEAPGE